MCQVIRSQSLVRGWPSRFVTAAVVPGRGPSVSASIVKTVGPAGRRNRSNARGRHPHRASPRRLAAFATPDPTRPRLVVAGACGPLLRVGLSRCLPGIRSTCPRAMRADRTASGRFIPCQFCDFDLLRLNEAHSGRNRTGVNPFRRYFDEFPRHAASVKPRPRRSKSEHGRVDHAWRRFTAGGGSALRIVTIGGTPTTSGPALPSGATNRRRPLGASPAMS